MVVTPIAQQETMVVVPAIRQRLLDLLTFRIEDNGDREREREELTLGPEFSRSCVLDWLIDRWKRGKEVRAFGVC